MSSYETARNTVKAVFLELLKKHPAIVSISPQMELDLKGRVSGNAIIVIGIGAKAPLRAALPDMALPEVGELPEFLVARDEKGNFLGEKVRVVVEDEGEVRPERNTQWTGPGCPGGYSIGHPNVTYGTLGCVAKVDGQWGYILSCNHVMAARDSGSPGDPIYQPAVYDGGGPGMEIAYLHRWVPYEASPGQNVVDCALAKVRDPWTDHVTREVKSVGIPEMTGDGHYEQEIRKSGRTTQYTTGKIVSPDAVVVLPYGVFVDQLKYTRMTDGGDSGSIIWDKDKPIVLGLHFAGSSSNSYGNKISNVLTQLGVARTVYKSNGTSHVFPKVEISVVD